MPDIHKQKPVRTKGVVKKTNYRDYKVQLQSDFNKRCGYCDDDDSFLGGKNQYHIDHFAPRSKFIKLESEYSNLIYSCPFCNRAKSNDWPSDSSEVNIVGDRGYVDPCHADYDVHLHREDSGKIVSKTDLGKYMHEHLKLYWLRHGIIWWYRKFDDFIEELEDKLKEKEYETEQKSKQIVKKTQDDKSGKDHTVEMREDLLKFYQITRKLGKDIPELHE